MLRLHLIFPLIAAASPLSQQSTILNSSYINPVFQQSWSNIVNDSLASINNVVNRPDYPFADFRGESGWTAVAQWDHTHGTRHFYDSFNDSQTRYTTQQGQKCFMFWKSPLCDCFNDDAAYAGLANLAGHVAYGDELFLERAESVHEFITNHGFISDAVIAEGYLQGTHYPNNTLQATCDGQTMYGGVYWQNGYPFGTVPDGVAEAAANPAVDSGSTGLYALLSAKLCETTQNMTYCDRSYDALHFMERFQIDPASGFVTGHILGNNCSKADHFVVTHNTGDYFASYAILSNITSNATALAIARKTVIAAMTTDLWNTAEGVTYNGDKSNLGVVNFKNAYMRRIHAVYPYMDSDVKDAIRQYVNIQYWSMVNRDSNDAKQPLLYGENWQGPSYMGDTTESQLETIDIFSALSLNADSAFPEDNSRSVPVISQASS